MHAVKRAHTDVPERRAESSGFQYTLPGHLQGTQPRMRNLKGARFLAEPPFQTLRARAFLTSPSSRDRDRRAPAAALAPALMVRPHDHKAAAGALSGVFGRGKGSTNRVSALLAIAGIYTLLRLLFTLYASTGTQRITLSTGDVLPTFAADVIRGMEDEPFTLFAPSESAMRGVTAAIDRARSTSAKEATRLKRLVVLSHVIADRRVSASDVRKGKTLSLTSLAGMPVKIAKAANGALTVETATATVVDVALGQGVVHLVDAVVLPAALKESLEEAGIELADDGEDVGPGINSGADEDAEDGGDDADSSDSDEAESADDDSNDATEDKVPSESGDEDGSARANVPSSGGNDMVADVSELERKRLEEERDTLRYEKEKQSLESLSALLKGKQRERVKRRRDEEENEDEEEEDPKAGEEDDVVGAKKTSPNAGEDENEQEDEDEEADNKDLVKVKDGVSTSERNAAAQEKCFFHGQRSSDGSKCTCSTLYSGKFCNEISPGVRWPTLTTPYKFTYVISQARLANEAKALSLGNAQVSLKMETPAEIVYLVEELTARTYGTLYQHVPASDPFIGVLHDTCALVGNSGSLMKHNYGDEIDEHNVVMRFNLAPTVGYEKHVGTKTTLRVSEMEYFPYRESSETILALIASEKLLETFMEYRTMAPLTDKSYVLSPEFIEYVSKSLGRGSIPSVGTMGLFFMLHTCRKVDVYGFHMSERHGARYHYFNKDLVDSIRLASSRNFGYDLSAALNRGGVINLVEPCLQECQVSLAKCAQCQGVSVPQLFRQQEFSPEQESLTAEHMARWHEQQDWRTRLRPQAQLQLVPDNANARSSRMSRRERARQRQIPKSVTDEGLLTLGWQYLISTGRVEELTTDGLAKYFEYHNLPLPETKLERIVELYKHFSQESRKGQIGGEEEEGGDERRRRRFT